MARRTLVLTLVFSLVSFTANASFLAIDYGSDWMKASLMKPGRGIDILLNTDSKRKIQSSVAWNGNERLFGTDAYNLAARFPKDSFSSLKYLPGSLYGGAQSAFLKQITQAEVISSDRGTCAIRRSDGTEWSVEELIAMQFAYVKGLAEAEAQSAITDVVVTVPPFYTQFERQAILDAIDIAGMRPLALVNDGMAVATNYAMTRTFPTKEHHIIYDAGASSITATVVSLYTGPVPDPTKVLKSSLQNSTFVEVKGFGFDTVASGTELDRRLRNALIKMYESKHGQGVSQNPRAMARLLKEAQRVKTILSANADSSISLESLLVENIDFKSRITRKTFEDLASDLVPRYSKPITDALAAAGLTMNDINSVIFFGGASRIPMIRKAVQKVAGDKIANNVNADEAAVLGAAYYGAKLKPIFRTKPMTYQDTGSYDIQAEYVAEGKSKIMRTPIFTPKSKTKTPKKYDFKRKNDFGIKLVYKNPDSINFPQNIMDAKVTGVSAAYANLTAEGAAESDIHVKVSFTLTESGMLAVEEPYIFADVKRRSFIEKVKSVLGGESSSSTTETNTDGSAMSATSTSTAVETIETMTTETITVPLGLEITPLSIKPLNVDQKTKATERLTAIVAAERAKERREEAYNHLEGYLYRLRDLLEGDTNSPFMEFSQPEERELLKQKLADGLTWLDEEGANANAMDLWKKRDELEAVEHPVIARYKEAESGPKALANLQKALFAGRTFLKEARTNHTAENEAGLPNRYTPVELDSVEELLKEAETWLAPLIEQQKLLTKRQDPVLKTAEMDTRGKAVQSLVLKLGKRKVPKVPKSSSSKPAESTATEQPQSEETASSKEKPNGRDEL